jgi:hypothetical protein
MRRKLLVQADFQMGPSRAWQNFFDTLLNSGKIEFPYVNNRSSSEYSLSFNHTDQQLQNIEKNGIPVENRILIMLECEQILPEMHKDSKLKKYGYVFSPSIFWAPNRETIDFKYIGYDSSAAAELQKRTKVHMAGMIQRNLFSVITGEMYTLRRSFLREINKTSIDFVLRGSNWENSTLKNIIHYFRVLQFNLRKRNQRKVIWFPREIRRIKFKNRISSVPDKLEFLSELHVAVVIENSMTYVSEKIFDCFISDCVPIYVGPPLESFGIPENLVIRAPNDPKKIVSIIENLDKVEIDGYLNRIRLFMETDGKSWSELNALHNLALKIINLIDDKN